MALASDRRAEAVDHRGRRHDKGVEADIVTMEGAVEVAPRTHLADAICDLVSTGNTLISNGLQEQDVILQSQAVLIKNNDMDNVIPSFEKITFNDVTFHYEKDKNVLKNLSFNIPSGKTTVIMGSSGAGKSTIIDLLLGLYRPSKGSIVLNKHDLLDINLHSWRDKIGYVGQDVFLFNASNYVVSRRVLH